MIETDKELIQRLSDQNYTLIQQLAELKDRQVFLPYEVWIDSSPRPVATFEYGDMAQIWAREHFGKSATVKRRPIFEDEK